MTGISLMSNASAIAAVQDWLSQLSAYRGSLPLNDPLLASGGSGWLIATLGRELAIVVDPAFPFTRPSVYLRDEHAATPHVERNGKLCLRNPEVPSDPIKATSTAIFEARRLLNAIDDGSEDVDFQEDFSLYWLHASSGTRPARLLLPGPLVTGTIAWAATAQAYYGFASPEELRRWWQHRFSTQPKIRRGALIALDRLPSPDDYPSGGADLWDFVTSRSLEGGDVLGWLLRQTPKNLLVVFAGTAPSGRRHAVGNLMTRSSDSNGRMLKRRAIENGYSRGKAPPEVLCQRHKVNRLRTEALDGALSRLPYDERGRLAEARVAVVGCGALGSGVAKLLAKSGVGHLVFIDPEKLAWENIRRHELGADAVGQHKASALALTISREIPDIRSTTAFSQSVESLLARAPNELENMDLIIACTAAWSANSALDAFGQTGEKPILYSWLEAHALAAHAVLILAGDSYSKGFDAAGSPRLAASASDKPVPAECGALTSPFGAVELSQAEALASRLALDFLRGKAIGMVWRTWLSDAEALADSEGHWTPDWIKARGTPNALGGISTGPWWST